MKKLISFILTCLLGVAAFSTLCGCGTQYKVEIDWTVDLSKPINLTGVYPYDGNQNFGDVDHDDTAKIIRDVTGYNVKYVNLSSGNGDNDVNNMLTTREPVNFYKLDQAQYFPYLEGGTFLDLTPILERTASGKMLYELIDLMQYGWDSVTYKDKNGVKHIYGVPDFGYCVMTDSALVWNRDHLRRIGYDHVPETMSEMHDAFYKLQEEFKSVDGYHAFCIPGSNSCEVTQLKGAFEVPFNFYLDDDGNIQHYTFSPAVDKYVSYMSELRRDGIISAGWQQSSAEDAMSKFADGLFSCAFTVYWNYTPLINSIVKRGKLAAEADIKNDYQTVHDELLGYSNRIRGDGTHGTVDQPKARIEGSDSGTSYYTVIPAYMADTALYTIDFLAKKLEHFAEFYGGLEGTHWNKLKAEEIPTDAPEYNPEDPWALSDYEDYSTGTIFVQPWTYKYNKYTDVRDPESNEIVGAELDREVTVEDGGYWIRLTEDYKTHIVNNSQYCNGTNSIAANRLFHLRETGFDAWPVTVPMDETIILNPMTMAPPFEHWAQINILSRTQAKRGIATAMDQTSPEAALAQMKLTRNGLKVTFKKKGGEKYYYWSDDIVKEMTDWYNEVKLGRE